MSHPEAIMEVCLDGVRLYGRHGLLPAEALVGNEFVLDVRVAIPVSQALAPTPDSGAHTAVPTLCYARLYSMVEKRMSVPAGTLEELAADIGASILAHWPYVLAVDVEITKTAPPIPRFRGSARVAWRWKAD